MTVVHDDQKITVPAWVTDIEAFRRWVHSDEVPEKLPVWWLQGEVWLDVSKQQVFTHVLVKTEFTAVLSTLVKVEKLGTFFTDGLLLSNFAADISGSPDGLFISKATRKSDRVRLIEGKEAGFVEIQGSPDMVLEVMSQSSVKKDDVSLRQAYFEADIPEYWIVDVRKEPHRFDILKRGPKGFSNTRKQDGWMKSKVFGKSFRLVVASDDVGDPVYTLEVK